MRNYSIARFVWPLQIYLEGLLLPSRTKFGVTAKSRKPWIPACGPVEKGLDLRLGIIYGYAMLRTNTDTQLGLSLVSLEQEVPQDYYLRRLDKVLDLSFVRERVANLYCSDNGRPAVDPELIIRLFLLQAIEGIASVRELMNNVRLHLGYRWFVGIELGQPLPDHSTLSRALDRFGDDVFNEIFQRSIAQCRASGLLKSRLVHVDATTIRADLDDDRVNKPGSSDPDARFGRFPDGVKRPGYKQHTVVEDGSRVILGVGVTPANVNEVDELVPLIDKAGEELKHPPETVCADSAYASGENAATCEDRGIQLVSPPREPRNHHSDEQFTIEEFTYDDERDVFICPNDKVLVNTGRFKTKKRRFKYRASSRGCQRCPLKPKCTKAAQRCLNVGEHHGALVRLRRNSQSDGFKALYRRRGPVIEGIFAESKQRHGLRRAWRRGLTKMRIQCLLIAAVLNFKRLAAHIGHFWLWLYLQKSLKTVKQDIRNDLNHCLLKILAKTRNHHVYQFTTK